LGTPPNAYFLIDTDGDRILDKKHFDLIIPFWAVKTSNMTDDDTGLISVLDNFYNSFQNNDGPNGPNSEIQKGMNLIRTAALDTETPNRDIYYLLHFYLSFNQVYPDVCLNSIKSLKQIMNERFGDGHALLDLFHFETLKNLRKIDEARTMLNELIISNSDFVPFNAYSYDLEQNPDIKKVKKEELILEYGEHWMVKAMLGL